MSRHLGGPGQRGAGYERDGQPDQLGGELASVVPVQDHPRDDRGKEHRLDDDGGRAGQAGPRGDGQIAPSRPNPGGEPTVDGSIRRTVGLWRGLGHVVQLISAVPRTVILCPISSRRVAASTRTGSSLEARHRDPSEVSSSAISRGARSTWGGECTTV